MITQPQQDVIDHLRKYGPTGRYAFHRGTVEALLRKGLVKLHPNNSGVLVLSEKRTQSDG